jgi:hypothetical protein
VSVIYQLLSSKLIYRRCPCRPHRPPPFSLSPHLRPLPPRRTDDSARFARSATDHKLFVSSSHAYKLFWTAASQFSTSHHYQRLTIRNPSYTWRTFCTTHSKSPSNFPEQGRCLRLLRLNRNITHSTSNYPPMVSVLSWSQPHHTGLHQSQRCLYRGGFSIFIPVLGRRVSELCTEAFVGWLLSPRLRHFRKRMAF